MKFSPYMILTGRSPRLRADNHLNTLTDVIDDSSNVEDIAVQFLEKVKLIASIHEDVLLNVEQAQKKQRSTKVGRAKKADNVVMRRRREGILGRRRARDRERFGERRKERKE
ncbi:unnamed protein product [Sphagnum jensenii]